MPESGLDCLVCAEFARIGANRGRGEQLETRLEGLKDDSSNMGTKVQGYLDHKKQRPPRTLQ